MKKRAFIFDMDGTMVDNMDHHAESWAHLFKETGHDVDIEDFFRTMAGRTTDVLLRQYVSPDLTPDQVEALAARKEEIYRDRYRPHLAPVPGLVDLLRQAKALGIGLAIGSSARQGNIDFVLDGLDLRPYFDIIVGAGDVKHGKPDPEMFLKAAAHLGVPPSNCTVFEDAKAGLDAAQAAGMPAILVAFDESIRALASHPAVTRVILDFTELLPLRA